MMQVNPFQILGMIKNGQNPQQVLMNVLEQQASQSPMYDSLRNMVADNRMDEVESFVRNYVNSQGGDFDTEFNAFKKNIGFK